MLEKGFYVVARKKDSPDKPFRYVESASTAVTSCRGGLGHTSHKYAPQVEAEKLQKEMQERGYEAHVVSGSEAIDLRMIQVKEEIERRRKKGDGPGSGDISDRL